MYINKEKKCVEMFDAHWYKVNDEYYPSVTSVLQCISKGYGYDEWQKSVGHNADIIVKKAQESGSKLHGAIEKQFLQGLELTPDGFEEHEWIKMCNFANWYNDLGIQAEHVEVEVYSTNLKIAGTADLICKFPADKKLCALLEIEIPTDRNWIRVLIDWKSGNNIYSTSHLQVAAYVQMWNALNPDEKVDGGAIVHIGATTKTKKDYSNVGVKFEPVNIPKSTKLFKYTMGIYDGMGFRKNPPMLEYPMTLKINKELLLTA